MKIKLNVWDMLDSNIKYDGKRYIWETVYKNVYKTNLISTKNIELRWINKRYQFLGKFKYKDKISEEMYFSGDIDFNFFEDAPNKKGKRRLYSEMLKILDSPENKNSDTAYIKQMLEMCNKRTERKANVSLMPSTGGMQFVKQSVGRDRLDTFVWCLYEHYENGNTILYNHCAAEYIKTLKSFLDLFESVYDYCECMYGISEELVNQLKESGSKPIDSPERVLEYIVLANKFWHEKIEMYQENGIKNPSGK